MAHLISTASGFLLTPVEPFSFMLDKSKAERTKELASELWVTFLLFMLPPEGSAWSLIKQRKESLSRCLNLCQVPEPPQHLNYNSTPGLVQNSKIFTS